MCDLHIHHFHKSNNTNEFKLMIDHYCWYKKCPRLNRNLTNLIKFNLRPFLDVTCDLHHAKKSSKENEFNVSVVKKSNSAKAVLIAVFRQTSHSQDSTQPEHCQCCKRGHHLTLGKSCGYNWHNCHNKSSWLSHLQKQRVILFGK